MPYIYNIFLSIILIFTIIYLSKKHNFLYEDEKNDSRKIHSFKTIRIGGASFFSILIFIFYINPTQVKSIIFLASIFLIIGIIEDIFQSLNNMFRLFLLTLSIFICVIFFDLFITEFKNEVLSNFITSNLIIMYSFSILGYLMLINGTNFIDGANGLLLGISLLIFFMFSIFSHQKSEVIFLMSTISITTIFPLFVINLTTGKILTGDGGAYFLGFLIGTIGIIAANENIIDEFLIASILFYPIAELLCTFFRRILDGRSPFSPDDLHIHIILFKIIKLKLSNSKYILKENFYNSLTSIVIISLLTITYLIIFNMNITNYFLIYLLLNLLYLITYFILLFYAKSVGIIENHS